LVVGRSDDKVSMTLGVPLARQDDQP